MPHGCRFLTLSEIDDFERFEHERRICNKEQIFSVFHIGNPGIDDRNGCHTGNHQQVQGINFIECVKPCVLRRIADIIRIGYARETIVSTHKLIGAQAGCPQLFRCWVKGH